MERHRDQIFNNELEKVVRKARDKKAALALNKTLRHEIKNVTNQASSKYVTMQIEGEDREAQMTEWMMGAKARDQHNMRVITHLHNNERKLIEELRVLKKRDRNDLLQEQNNNRKLVEDNESLRAEIYHLENKCKHATTNVQNAERKIKELDKAIEDIRELNKENIVKLAKFEKENIDLGSELSSKVEESKLLYNSLEIERDEHESEMEELQRQITEMQNEYFDLWLILKNIHKCSKISVGKMRSLFDFNFVNQKLEEARAEEEHLTKTTTKTLKSFASVQDRTGCIKVLKERFEKSYTTSENEILSDDHSDMEDNTTNFSFNTYPRKRLGENRNMTNCHNRQDKNTNVYNINMNIAGSKVSLIDNTEPQMLGMSDRSDDRQEIEAKS